MKNNIAFTLIPYEESKFEAYSSKCEALDIINKHLGELQH